MLSWQLILIQVVIFIGLIVILRSFFSRNLSSALTRLKDLQEENLVKESQFKDELERVKQERLAEIEKAKQEACKIVEDAKRETEIVKAKLIAEGRQEKEKIIEQGKDELGKLRENILANIESRALDLSLEIVKCTFSQKGKTGLQYYLIDELIEEMQQIDQSKLPQNINKITVITGLPLTDEEKIRIKNIISGKINNEVTIEEEIDSGIIAGFLIKLGQFVIDGSLKNKLAKMMPYLKK